MAVNNFSRSYATAVRKGFIWILALVIVVLGLWHFLGDRLTGKTRRLPKATAVAETTEPAIIIPKAAERIQPDAGGVESVTPASSAALTAAQTPPAVAAASPAQPTAEVVSNSAGAADFEVGMAAFGAKDYLKTRDLLSRAVQKGLDPQRDSQARDALNKAADQWLFSRNVFDGDSLCQIYKVAQGDLMVSIGKKFDVPHTFIMKINGIENPSKLHVGQAIKVVRGPFQALVERGKFRMTVYLGSAIARTYRVGLGGPGRQTPTGLWIVQVGKKQINPAWPDSETGKYYYPDDPENPLGERWIGLQGVEGDAVGRNGFGIHGTIKPEEIGHAASRGCIRLLNSEVEEVYDMMTEGKTQVRLVE